MKTVSGSSLMRLSELERFGNAQAAYADVVHIRHDQRETDVLSPFWTAVLAGMASPVALYAPSPGYGAYTATLSPAQSFSVVGRYLSDAAGEFERERPQAKP